FARIDLLSVSSIGRRPDFSQVSRAADAGLPGIRARVLFMSVATHLGIQLSEYDARIRTFIPDYEEMIAVAGAAVPADTRTILDLGVGTGALAASCLAHARRAHAIGIDADAEVLTLAARRLGSRATLVAGSFTTRALPRCDVAVGSFSLHHIRTRH